MKIDAYKTQFGLFSVINDTALYQAVTNATNAYNNLHGLYFPAMVAAFAGQELNLDMVALLGAAVPGYVPVVIPSDIIVQYPGSFVWYDDPLSDNRIMHYTFRKYNAGLTRYGELQFISSPVADATKINIMGGYDTSVDGGSMADRGFAFVLLTNEYVQFRLIQIRATTSAVSYTVTTLTSTQNTYYSAFFRGLDPYVAPVPPEPGDDPYSGAGDSVVGGGGGDFNYTSDPPGGFNDFSPPSISATDAGFITLYNPTIQELNALASYLWSSSFDLNTFKKLFNDPMDLFLGLSILPVAIPDGGRQSVGIGLIDTGVTMTVAGSQWVAVNCGSVTVNGFSGSYLDYDPYTNIEIYLPYIGVRSLKADEVVGHTLSVNYWVDILSGACVAWLDIDGHLMYTFMGQCATSIPVASGDWTNIINGVLSVIGGAVGGAVKGGVGGAIAGGVSSASAVAVTEGKISVERSGTISSAGGLLSYQKPFLIFSAPRLCKPANQNVYEGYPAYVTMQIGNLSGFTQIELVHITGIYGTDSELDEIKELLLSGVII